MRLVLREVQHERHGADQVFAVKGAENDPLAAIGGSQRVAPECICHLNGSGCMKLTEPPFATASTSISLSVAQVSGEEFRA